MTEEKKKKINCWEFKKCGREPGGKNSDKLGVCPSATVFLLDEIHCGKNAGRACWVVAGTLCGGDVQGEFAKKYEGCKDCAFYKLVKIEEGADFVLSATLLAKLKKEIKPSEGDK